jgi:asparagine N-glycosylation enzyme membrane subunit Stt3
MEQKTRPGFARIASAVLWVLAVVFVLGAAQVSRALWSHKVWVNYRGEVIGSAEMRRELVFYLLATSVCALLAWYWQRSGRRRS